MSSASEGVVGGLPAHILETAGLDPGAYRAGPLERRLTACLRTIRSDSEQAARTRLAGRPELAGAALNTLLIGVSGFFRDPAVFDALRSHVVPALRECSGPIRIWSVGCSHGAELYSLAILLAEAQLLDRAYLLGSDCRPDAVDHARAGVFADALVADIDPELRARYFDRSADGWRIARGLRDATAWQVADATRNLAEGPWNLVLCRNVVIYLQSRAADALMHGIVGSLAPGGFLVVGKAERPGCPASLSAVSRCIHVKHDE